MTPRTSIPTALASRLSEDLPAQKAFAWNRAKWAPVVHDVPDARRALDALPNLLDRAVVREVVQGNLQRDLVMGAFVPVLIWGGPGGYGPFRARTILTGVKTQDNIDAPVDETIRDRLMEGSEVARRSGAVEAFRLMNNDGKVKYLGGAFFTKWLAFSSMVDSIDGRDVAPILDKRVRDWIAAHTEGGERVWLSTSSSGDYGRYVELLEAWGTPFGRTCAEVELAIFDLTRDRPADE